MNAKEANHITKLALEAMMDKVKIDTAVITKIEKKIRKRAEKGYYFVNKPYPLFSSWRTKKMLREVFKEKGYDIMYFEYPDCTTDRIYWE